MRRLVLLLLAVVGVLGLAPAAPARVHALPAAHHATAPAGCHDDGQAATHTCVGCAVAPERLAIEHGATLPAGAPHEPAPATLIGRRIGFDPPPPRRAA
ncbi:hypothetical protein [Sphingomonas sp.]|uniref:hypothetical protein n=1 Tax=Sphingomonas sp. TaxID=28214 RepID=UPI003B00CDA9